MISATSIGSCRVYTPLKMLRDQGRIRGSNGYSFQHYTSEIIQQLKCMTGEAVIPRRLWHYANVPSFWPPPRGRISIEEVFPETDVFVVEVSSIRALRFKAVYLQINRTRERLTEGREDGRDLWDRLLTGRDDKRQAAKFDDPVKQEIFDAIEIWEQTPHEIARDLKTIATILKKPILFVSHFNTGFGREEVPNRRLIVDALSNFATHNGHYFFDPTPLVHAAGPALALKDLAHYTPVFESELAERLFDEISRLKGV